MKPAVIIVLSVALSVLIASALAQPVGGRYQSIMSELNKTTINKQNEASIKRKIDTFNTLVLVARASAPSGLKGTAEVYNGRYHYFKNDFPRALSAFRSAEKIFKATNDKKQLAKVYVELAKLSDKQGKTQQATNHYLNALLLVEKDTTQTDVLSAAYYGLGTMFTRISDYNKAIFYKKKAFDLRDRLSPEKAIRNYTSLAITYGFRYDKTHQKADLDSSYQIATSGYELAHKANLLADEGRLLDILISHDLLKSEFAKAEKRCDESIAIGRQVDETIVITGIYHKVDALVGQRNYAKALFWSDSLLLKTKKEKNSFYDYYYRTAIEQRYDVHKKAGNYRQALAYAEQFVALKDSLLLSEKTAAINELETKYETEKKQKAIELLTAQNRANEATIQQRTYLLIAVVAVALLLVGYFYFLTRQRALQQKRQAAEMKQRLLRAQLNPHFLFNSLNSIQRLYVEGRTTQANDFIADFAQLMRDILEKTGRTHIPLYEEIDFIEAYLSLEKRRLGDKFDYQIVMDEQVRHSDIEVPSFIIQPLAENALLHGLLPREGQRGQLDIIVAQQGEGSVSITVQDNGVGFHQSLQQAGKHQSRGMDLIRQRLGKRGRLLIEEIKSINHDVVGTKVELMLTA